MKFLGSLLSIGLMFVGQGAWVSVFKTIGMNILSAKMAGTQQGPKLSDLSINLDGEGLEKPRGWGRWRQDTRLAHCKGLVERKEEKGGSLFTPSSTEFEYGADAVYLVGQGPITGAGTIRLGTLTPYEWNDGDEKGMNFVWLDVDGGHDESKEGYWEGTWRIKGKNSAGTMRLYKGTLNQPVDPIIIRDKGAGNGTNYPGQVILAVEYHDVQPYSNTVPRPSVDMRYDVIALKDVIEEVAGWVGRKPEDFNLDALDGMTVQTHDREGFLADSRRGADAILGDLCDIYHFCLVDSIDGVITAVLSPPDLTNAPTFTDKNLRVTAGYELRTDVAESPMSMADEQELTEVQEIVFYDINRDRQAGYRYAAEFDTTSKKKSSRQYSAFLKGSHAGDVARVTLSEERAAGTGRSGTTALEYLFVAASDGAWVETPDGVKPMVVDIAELPTFGAIKFNFKGIDPLAYNLPELPDTEGLQRDTPIEPGIPILFVAQCSIVAGDGFWVNTPALIAAACAYPGDVWGAYRINYDKMVGGDWKEFDEDPLPDEAVIGELTAPYTPLHPSEGFVGSESFTCRLYGLGNSDLATPTSTGDADNYILFQDGTIVCFHSCVKTGESATGDFYEFSDLYSAVWGTDDFMETIASGQRFVILQYNGRGKSGPIWAKMGNNPASLLGQDLRVRLLGEDENVFLEVDNFAGNNVKAPSPTIESVSRGGSGELLISGRARTRFLEDNFATTTDTQFKEYRFADGYKYRLEMVGDTVSKTLELYTTHNRGSFDFSISDSDLTALFGSVPTELTGTIALVGEFGRGRTTAFTADII